MDIKINKHTVSVKQIQDSLHKLQSAKSDCKDQLLSDHFINGTVRCFTLISLLFTCMLTHGVAPKDNRGSKSDSSNYS